MIDEGAEEFLKDSTECTRDNLPERPRRGESMAVASSLSRFRLAEPSCFCLDATAGALLVVAPVFCLPSPDLYYTIYRCSC